MKLIAVSDLHGNLPPLPESDLILIAGDICPAHDHSLHFQAMWLDRYFRAWLSSLRARMIIGVAGNHDLLFEQWPSAVPKLPWIYLQDSGTEFEGLKIFGSPWQPTFFNWSFNLDEPDLEKKWRLIPDGTDILVLHGPPHGFGDAAPRENGGFENTGSPSLLKRILDVKPKLCVFGHIHEGRGTWKLGDTTLANVTLLDGQYRLVHEPMVFEL